MWQPDDTRSGSLELVKFPKQSKVSFIACGPNNFGAILIPLHPTWAILKQILVGWAKDTGCFFYEFPSSIFVSILEIAWNCKMPPSFPGKYVSEMWRVHEM